ncbi:MAG: sugar transporter, partial [Acidobacteria bacterium]|nr:sugar transporter [Acidobacteriota bacterium]
LTAIDFPTDADVSAIDQEMVDRLGWLYGPVLAFLYLAAIFALRYYRLSRHRHQENLAMLAGAEDQG